PRGFAGCGQVGPGAPCRRCRPPTATRWGAPADHAFVTGFNAIALVSVAVAALGSVAGYALVRSRDFVAASGPAAAPPAPGGAGPAVGVGAGGGPASGE